MVIPLNPPAGGPAPRAYALRHYLTVVTQSYPTSLPRPDKSTHSTPGFPLKFPLSPFDAALCP